MTRNDEQELREILKWVDENPIIHRSPLAQTLYDAGTALAWMLFGAVAFVAVFGSIFALLFVSFFG